MHGEMQTRVHVSDGNVTFESIQDCTSIVERAKRMHNEGITGSSEMKYAARIPDVIVEKYCIDNNLTFREFCCDEAHLKRVLNDPAMAAFRIWKGKV